MVIVIPAASGSPADFGSLASLGCCAVALCCAAPHATAQTYLRVGTESRMLHWDALKQELRKRIYHHKDTTTKQFLQEQFYHLFPDGTTCSSCDLRTTCAVLYYSVLLHVTWCVMRAVALCRQCVLAEFQSRGASSAVRAAHEVESPIPAVEAPIRADCRQSLASQRQH